MSSIGRIVPRRVAQVSVERRAAPRIGVVMEARVRLPELDVAFCGTILDVSEGGAFVATAELLPLGAAVELEVSPPRLLVPLLARGVVVRQRVDATQPGLGLRFTWLSAEARALLARLGERSRRAG